MKKIITINQLEQGFLVNVQEMPTAPPLDNYNRAPAPPMPVSAQYPTQYAFTDASEVGAFVLGQLKK